MSRKKKSTVRKTVAALGGLAGILAIVLGLIPIWQTERDARRQESMLSTQETIKDAENHILIEIATLQAERLTVPTKVVEVEPLEPLKIELYENYQASGIFIVPDSAQSSFLIEEASQISSVNHNTLIISLLNTSPEEIIIGKEVPFKVNNYLDIGEPVDVFLSASGGGRSYYINFSVRLTPQIGNHHRAQFGVVYNFDEASKIGDHELPLTEEPDYFSIQPMERELIAFEIDFSEPGTYVFQPGIRYFYGGSWKDDYLEQTFTAIVPASIIGWYGEPIYSLENNQLIGYSGLERRETCELSPLDLCIGYNCYACSQLD